jgi:hypothetical protein
MKLQAELTERAFDIAWAGLREREAVTGRMSDLERARCILARLYPEMIGARLEWVIADLEACQKAGTWNGFAPPRSFREGGGRP